MNSKLVAEALRYYGMAEIPGEKENPAIVKMSQDLGYNVRSEDTPWCGIFMAWCVHNIGGKPPAGAMQARKWLNFGIETLSPEPGDIVVFWRGTRDGWRGHVSLFINYAGKDQINCLGGNQGNRVCIAPYDVDQILGYRRWDT